MDMHAAAVVTDQGLGHEGRGLAVTVGDVVHHILENLGGIRTLDQRIEAGADFALTGGRHFVVMNFDRHAHLLKDQTHGRADILQRIDRRHREIAALHARPMTDVAVIEYLGRVPRAFVGIDVKERTLHFHAPTHIVEDEEFRFRAKERGITHAGRFEVSLGALGDRTRAADVTLAGRRFDDIAADDEGFLFEERIHDGGGWVRHEDHVGLIDALPTGDGRTIEHLAFFEEFVVAFARRHGEMLFLALGIRKPDIDEFNFFVLDRF